MKISWTISTLNRALQAKAAQQRITELTLNPDEIYHAPPKMEDLLALARLTHLEKITLGNIFTGMTPYEQTILVNTLACVLAPCSQLNTIILAVNDMAYDINLPVQPYSADAEDEDNDGFVLIEGDRRESAETNHFILQRQRMIVNELKPLVAQLSTIRQIEKAVRLPESPARAEDAAPRSNICFKSCKLVCQLPIEAVKFGFATMSWGLSFFVKAKTPPAYHNAATELPGNTRKIQ